MKSARYVTAVLAVAALMLSPLGLSALFLLQSGELMDAAQVAKWLQQNDGIYGTALNNNYREIAFAIYNERKPDIIVMASSRGVDFRREFFTAPFSCVCTLMQNVEEGIHFFDAVKDSHLPKVAILALDYWWFSMMIPSRPWIGDYASPIKLTRANILAPYKWISEGKLTVTDVLLVAAGIRNLSPLSSEPKIGIQAIKLSNGTRADGSWSPLGTASTPNRPLPVEVRMERVLKEPELLLQETADRYAPDQKLGEDGIVQLQRLIDGFQQRGTKVVLLMLPIITPFVEEMEKSGRYQFIWELRTRLTQMNVEYNDFFDPRTFNSSACEFKDPHHGGNAMYARMLKTILDRNPSSVLKDFVNYSLVADVAQRFAGRVVATIGPESTAFREQDFLKLGCRK